MIFISNNTDLEIPTILPVSTNIHKKTSTRNDSENRNYEHHFEKWLENSSKLNFDSINEFGNQNNQFLQKQSHLESMRPVSISFSSKKKKTFLVLRRLIFVVGCIIYLYIISKVFFKQVSLKQTL